LDRSNRRPMDVQGIAYSVELVDKTAHVVDTRSQGGSE
jgi:hypothetical protein